MKVGNWLVSMIVVTLMVMPWLSVASAASDTCQIDRKGIEARKEQGGLILRIPVDNTSRAPLQGSLSVRITDLDKNVIVRGKEQVTLTPGRHDYTVRLVGEIPEERYPQSIIQVTLSVEQQAFQATKSLFEAIPHMETRLVGYRELLAGSRAAVRLVSLNHATGEPVPNAAVQMHIVSNGAETEVFNGKTNAEGTLEASFAVPEKIFGGAELRIRVSASGLGEDKISQPITIARKARILLTTDKPLYQPGQRIRMRALSLRAGDLSPVGDAPLVFEVMDGKGNKVFKKKVATDAFGVAAVEFPLATEVNLGAYVVRAILEENTAEKQVTVERYVLPKFKIEAKTNRDYYIPGETLEGEVQADYFFGKPVSGGKVKVVASKFEIEFERFAEAEGTLDVNGHWSFEMPLPGYFAGTPIEQGNASVRLEIEVVDAAEHREEKVVMKPVAPAALLAYAIPESGALVPRLENTVFILVSYPDGTPVNGARVVASAPGIHPEDKSVKTNPLGIAHIRLRPRSLEEVPLIIEASDDKGNTVRKTLPLSFKAVAESLILRTDKTLYSVGDTLAAEILSTKERGTVYVDLVREGQTVLTRATELSGGKASVAVDIDATMAGSVVLHAYIFSPGTDLIRDTRLLYVNPADAVSIGVELDRDTYKPGENARIRFATTDKAGSPVPAALGIAIVDESVFALQEIHPGLEKIYFTLEHEIMKPRYEIHGYELEELVKLPPLPPGEIRPMWSEEQQEAARVLLASAPEVPEPPVRVNTFEEKAAKAREAVEAKFQSDFDHIAKAVARLVEKSRGQAIRDVKQELLRQKLLRPSDLIDPWGNPYEFDFSATLDSGGYFRMSSAGPDGETGTADDLSTEYYPEIRRARGFGGGGVRQFLAGAVPEAVMMKRGDVAMDMAMPSAVSAEATSGAGSDQQAVRIREYFPETLLFEPSLITDEHGIGTLNVEMADSITTWRMTTMASTRTGALGSLDKPIRVFQDFFVDLDLPVALTQNDKVSIPVVVYNYLDQPQDVRLKFETAPWFTLDGDSEKTVQLNVGEVRSVYFPIEVSRIGTHKLTVFAYGSRMSDAIRREIEVRPDGEEQLESVSDRLSGRVEHTITIPEDAIADASKILVRIYPGVFSQIVDGLDSMLQMPFGCFEQTSSVTYPNILVVQYLKATKQINPEIQMKAEGFINAGYQRLLSYEVRGGGFSWFGDAPANKVLTAWGLKEFYDMSLVHEVDPAVLERTRGWLLAQQESDGSWKPDESYLHAESWSGIQNSRVLVTAYILDALLNGGAPAATGQKAMDYIRANVRDAKEAYTLALIANAAVSWNKNDAFTNDILSRLYEMRQETEQTVFWKGSTGTVTFSHGDAADIETTALATIAFLNAGKYPEATTKALTYLIQKKSAQGHWGSTQATILALKALTLSLGSRTEKVDATITVALNDEKAGEIRVTPEDSDVMRLLDLGDRTKSGANKVTLEIAGEGSMLYQIVGRYYKPWSGRIRPPEEPMSITVKYDKTTLAVNDLVTASVTVRNNRPASAQMIIVDLGIPPGFDVVTADLEKLVEEKKIQKYELTGRQIITYFERLEPRGVVEFSYKLRARFPMRAQTPESKVYEYYNPEVRADAVPLTLVVE